MSAQVLVPVLPTANNLSIQAAPGMDEAALARLVAAEIEKAQSVKSLS